MIPREANQGFALALLLWMIAGMSLTVAAVIHFARTDTGLAELRLTEAKARALGRGVALLALRERAMREQTSLYSDEEGANPNADANGGLFTATYAFDDIWSATVTLRPANGYVSLNNASVTELSKLFIEIGEATPATAEAMADAVVEYRETYPGFRYREELLMIREPSKPLYDRVQSFVHPFRTGGLASQNAASGLSEHFAESDSDQSESDTQPNPAVQAEGVISFASMHQAKREQMGLGDNTMSVAEVTVRSAGQPSFAVKVWLGESALDPVVRVDPVTTAAAGGLLQ